MAALENQLEPEYAEAVLEYNAKNLDGALKLLTELQKRAPQTVEILELRAITLKAMKNDKDAETPKHSLEFCQDSLREYMKCQDLHDKKKNNRIEKISDKQQNLLIT